MNRLMLILFAVLVLAGCADPSTPTPTATPAATPTITPIPGPLFTLVSDEPIIAHGGADWEGDFMYPAGMVFHDGLYYLFRVGGQFEGQVIGYHTSPDLVTWTQGANNPLINSADLPDSNQQFLPWSVLVDDTGTWLMYFWRWNRGDSRGAWIGRATAPGPDGPWDVDDTHLLDLEGGAWDDSFIQSPSVVQVEDGTFAMLYQGSGPSPGPEDEGFGWATSPDGVEWTRHPAPVFARNPFNEWESDLIQQAHMVHTPDGGDSSNLFVMLYEGYDGTGPGSDYGIATSVDGIEWTRYPGNPAIGIEDFPEASFTHISNIFYHEGTYYLLLEVANAEGDSTDIYLATYEGRILP